MPNTPTAKEQYFDFTGLKQFVNLPNSPANRVTDGALFRDGLANYAVTNQAIAIRILKAIKVGQVNIFCQERILDWFLKYHEAVLQGYCPELTCTYFDAMDVVVNKIDTWFKYRQYSSRLTNNMVQEYVGFGDHAVIAWMLQNLRFCATREAFRHWAGMYGRQFSHHVIERPGIVRLYIDKPRNAAYANNFKGRYVSGAKIIHLPDENRWEIIFDDYFPLFNYRSSMWIKMYHKIAPMAASVLLANVYWRPTWLYDE